MKLPSNIFLAGITEREIFYFASTKINSSEPHHFICIKRTDNDILILACCTSQKDTIERLIKLQNLPYNTIVAISPDAGDDNPFTKDTFVNCNDSFTYTLDEFRAMYESHTITCSGKISEIHYEQILIGIHASTLIDEDTKELIPKPEELL